MIQVNANAALDTEAGQSEAVGRIAAVRGSAIIIRAGFSFAPQVGDLLFPGDAVRSASGAAVGLALIDGSGVSLGENTHSILDEVIYDPDSQTGKLTLSVIAGSLVFESGAIPNWVQTAAVIRTPAAGLEVFSSLVGITVTGAGALDATLLDIGDSAEGVVTVSNEEGSAVLRHSLSSLSVSNASHAPEAPHLVSWSDVMGTYQAPASLLRTFEPSPITSPAPPESAQPSAAQEDSAEPLFADRIAETRTDAGTPRESEGGSGPHIRVVDGEQVAGLGTGTPYSIGDVPPVATSTIPASASERRDEAASGTGASAESEAEQPSGPPNQLPSTVGEGVSGAEDQVITGQLSATDPDADSLTFAVAAGGAPLHGSVQVNPDGSYTYQPDSNFSGTDSFVYVVSDGRDGTATASVVVELAPVADAPDLQVADVVGAEDSAIALSISAQLVDASESLSVRVSGVPAGATLSAGTDNGDGSWTLARGQLSGLAITPPQHYSGSFNLSFEATSSVPETGETAAISDDAMVVVNAVADMPVLGVAPASGTEDVSVPLTIAAELVDPSETVHVEISGLPAGASLNAGADRGDGTWVVAPGELTDLRLSLPQDFGQSFQLSVAAVSTDDQSVAATPVATLDVTMTATGDITLNASSTVRAETNAPVTVPLDLQTAISDVDLSESLTQIVVTFDQDLPAGATVNGGTLDGRVLTIAAADVANASVVVPADWSGTIDASAVAYSNEGQSAPADVTLRASGVADAPSLFLTVTPDEAATAAARGGYVSVWEEPNLDGDTTGIFAQRFAGNGTPLGGQFQVNTTLDRAQDNPSVAMQPGGGFVVVWESAAQDGSNDGVYMQRYNVFGGAVGGEIQVNTFTTGDQHNAYVMPLAGGGFLVTWDGRGAGDTAGIFARCYGTDGLPIGDQFQVNATLSGAQNMSAASALPDGGFVITWEGAGTGDTQGIYAQRFNASATPVGSEFRVNVTTSQTQDLPDVVGLNDGTFVVVWHGRGTGDTNAIFMRHYDGAGAPLTGEVLVNTTTLGTQTRPTVGMLADGSFVVAWDGRGAYDTAGIYAQRFAADGTRLGGEILVNTTTGNTQDYPSVSPLANGGFVVNWESSGQDGSMQGIFGRRFDSAGIPTSGEFQVNTETQGSQADPDAAGLSASSGPHFFSVAVDAAFGDYADASESHQVRIDVPEGFALVSDPSTWTDLPSGVSAMLNDGDVVFSAATGSEGIDSFSYAFPVMQEAEATAATFSGVAQASEIDSGDTATAAAYSQLVLGTPESDDLSGSDSAETIYGGLGDDSAAGAGGADDIYGDEGADTLSGGAGDDTLTGGEGNDTFVFAPEDESGAGDLITDFSSGDELRISGAAADLDDLSFEQVGDDTIIHIGGHEADVTLNDVDADQLVSYQLTPDPDSDLIVVLNDENTPGG